MTSASASAYRGPHDVHVVDIRSLLGNIAYFGRGICKLTKRLCHQFTSKERSLIPMLSPVAPSTAACNHCPGDAKHYQARRLQWHLDWSSSQHRRLLLHTPSHDLHDPFTPWIVPNINNLQAFNTIYQIVPHLPISLDSTVVRHHRDVEPGLNDPGPHIRQHGVVDEDARVPRNHDVANVTQKRLTVLVRPIMEYHMRKIDLGVAEMLRKGLEEILGSNVDIRRQRCTIDLV